MDRSRFLKEYVLDVKTEFTIDGKSTDWPLSPTVELRTGEKKSM